LNETVTVVMAVYNEVSTVNTAIELVLNHHVDGAIIDLVIVESNSTDGTKDIVRKYLDNPRVTVILQDSPKGKGNAIREGLKSAKGSIILIQDADLEYDIQDYARLIHPIIDGTADFVLGSRHVKGKSMRHFETQPVKSQVLNFAHWVFAVLFSVTYGTVLRDPFTMYKVFRRDAIKDVKFYADRFDFDWELVAKLIRNGYRPIEIPVTYHSRSFEEGKKVRMLRDPITWIVALIRFRFGRLK
jgi:glycosyltransferase involved in cell wall biosynthesis